MPFFMPPGPASVPILSSTYLKVRLRNMGPSVEPSDTKQDHIATPLHLNLRRPRLLRILMGICAVLARAVLDVAAGYTSGVALSVYRTCTKSQKPSLDAHGAPAGSSERAFFMPSGRPPDPILSSMYLKVRLRKIGPTVESSAIKQGHIATAFHLALCRTHLNGFFMTPSVVLEDCTLSVRWTCYKNEGRCLDAQGAAPGWVLTGALFFSTLLRTCGRYAPRSLKCFLRGTRASGVPSYRLRHASQERLHGESVLRHSYVLYFLSYK